VFICDTLLSLMADNVAHAGVQRKACSLLEALTTDAVRPVMSMATVGGAVLAAMRAHPQEEGLHVQACLALQQLAGGATNSDIYHEFGMALAAAGGLCAVLDAMRAHPARSAAVQEAACGALRRITHAAENKVAAGRAGAIRAVVTAMNAHGAYASVQEQACAALAVMAVNDDNVAKACSFGAIEAVVTAMNAHGAHAGVQAQACWALRNLTADNDDNQAKAGSAGAIEAVVAAAHTHGVHARVQEHACRALVSLTANKAKAGSAGVYTVERPRHAAPRP
jgi:hypothetical protein